MYCKTCGCENDDRNVQCEVCGAELEKVNIESNTDKNEKNQFPKKKLNKNEILIISLIFTIVLVVIISVAVIIHLMQNTKDTYDDNLNTTNYCDEYYDENATENTAQPKTTEITTEKETRQETTQVKTTEKTTEPTTLSQEELDRQKALEYLKKADEALKSGEREGALQMADAAIELCDDRDIKEKYDYYYLFAPFALYDEDNTLQIKNYDHTEPYFSSIPVKANDQTEMNNCISMFYDYTVTSDPLSEVSYNLARKYDTLSGIEFITNSKKSIEQEGYFEIFGDGKKLYTSQTFKPSVLPKKFTIDVSGVDRLIIVFHGHTDHWDSLGGGGGYEISNLIALKDLP